MTQDWFESLFIKSKGNRRTAWAYSSVPGTMSVNVTNGKHMWVSDEPANFNGTDLGPNPVELLMGSLAACSLVTIIKKARESNLDLPKIAISCSYSRILSTSENQEPNQKGKIKVTRSICIPDMSETFLLDKLRVFADSCPVETILMGDVNIETSFYSV